MRDWLALPINTKAGGSPTTPSSIGNQVITTDNMTHENASTEQEERQVTDCSNKHQGQKKSTWLSILNLFGVAKKSPPPQPPPLSSSRCIKNQREINTLKPKVDVLPISEPTKDQVDVSSISETAKDQADVSSISETAKDQVDVSSISETAKDQVDVSSISETAKDQVDVSSISETAKYQVDIPISDDMEKEETTHVKRTLSSSSLASSLDTDNSTPGSSHIMTSSSSPSKYNHAMSTHVKICWNHGGKQVRVTGEFDNWSAPVDLVQDTENPNCHVVDIPMDLSKDVEFKFIVDGEWRYANDLPHRTDERGNVNNVVCKKE